MTQSISQRMMRAARLDPELYEEVEADPATLRQATTVVVLSALGAGVGNLGQGGAAGLGLGVVAALAGWYVWAFLAYWVGTRLLPEAQTDAEHGELLRTLGFATAPGVLRIFAVIPGLYTIVFLVTGIWMLVAGVIAVRQALDYTSTARAIGVCLVGWLVQSLLILVVLVLLML